MGKLRPENGLSKVIGYWSSQEKVTKETAICSIWVRGDPRQCGLSGAQRRKQRKKVHLITSV